MTFLGRTVAVFLFDCKKPSGLPLGFALSISEIKQPVRRDLQNLAQLEGHIKGNAHVSQLNGADMAAVNIHQFRQLQLGHFLALAIIYNIQAKLLI